MRIFIYRLYHASFDPTERRKLSPNTFIYSKCNRSPETKPKANNQQVNPLKFKADLKYKAILPNVYVYHIIIIVICFCVIFLGKEFLRALRYIFPTRFIQVACRPFFQHCINFNKIIYNSSRKITD